MTVLSARPTGWQTPYEVLDWGLALHPSLLASGETIVAGSWSLSPADGTLAVWARVSVVPAQRDHPRWSGRGTVIAPAASLTTNRDRVWWREVPITIVRGAWSASPRVLLIAGPDGGQ